MLKIKTNLGKESETCLNLGLKMKGSGTKLDVELLLLISKLIEIFYEREIKLFEEGILSKKYELDEILENIKEMIENSKTEEKGNKENVKETK